MNEFISLHYKLVKKVSIDNIYVKIGKNIVPVKNLSPDQKYLEEFLQKNQKDDFFYIGSADLEKIIKQNSSKIKQINSVEETIDLLDTSASLLYEAFKNNQINKEILKNGYSLIEGTVTSNSNKFLSNIIEKLSVNADIGSHSFMRSLICYSIAQSLGWQREKNYEHLIISSVLADVGNILAPNEAHPRNSLKYLGPYANNSDVIKIVEHHHENFDGSGPLGLVKKDIHPLSKILRVADAIIEKSNNSLLEGIQEALREDKNLYDKDCIESLLNHFKQKKVA